MKRRSNQSGTTLVETIISMMVAGILLLAAARLAVAGWGLYIRTQQRFRAIAQAEAILTVLTADLRSATGWLRLCETDPQNPADVFVRRGQDTGNAAWFMTEDGDWILLDAGALPSTITEDGVTEPTVYGTVHRRSFFAQDGRTPPGCLWYGPDGYLARDCTRLGSDAFTATIHFSVQEEREAAGQARRVQALQITLILQNAEGRSLCRRETVVFLPDAPQLLEDAVS